MDEKRCDISGEECSQRLRLAFQLEKEGKKGVADFFVSAPMMCKFLTVLCEEAGNEVLLRALNRAFGKEWHKFVKPLKRKSEAD